ncbi:MAG: hypothetical protein FWG27_02520 [Treponema sp.]|nr:hypothetical protein [Treponema sp.]
METVKFRCPRKRRFCELFLLLVLAIVPSLYAQDSGKSVTRVVRTVDGLKLFQVITFSAVPNAQRYELEIEQLIEGNAVPAEKIETTINKVEVSLNAGNYRYRVRGYNKMNLLEGQSEWQDFEILPGIMPVAETFQLLDGLLSEKAKTSGSITVTGRDFFPDSEFALVRHKKNYDWSGAVLKKRKDAIIPDQVVVNDGEAVLTFKSETLKKGEYDIFIRNPGGLWTLLEQVRVGSKNNNEFIVSFGWIPLVPLSGKDVLYTHDNVTGNKGTLQMLESFNPKGAGFCFAWLPFHWGSNTLGFELEYNILDYMGRAKNTEPNTGAFELLQSEMLIGVRYQRKLNDRFYLNARLGAGSASSYYLEESSGGDVSRPSHEFNFGIKTGASVQFFLWRNLYAEAGLGITSVVSGKGSPHIFLRPSAAVGWQFNRN